MGGYAGNAGGHSIWLDELPDDFLGKHFTLRRVGPVDGPEDAPISYRCRRSPRVDCNFHPGRHRHSADPTMLADQIHDAPPAITLLKMRKRQVCGFGASEPAP
jgi:hypothetical protein